VERGAVGLVWGFEDPPLLVPAGLVPLEPPEPPEEVGCEELLCCVGGPLGLGAGEEAVLVDPVPVWVVVGGEVVAPVVVEPVVGAAAVGAQVSEIEAIGSVIGREICDSGVPGGTFTVNDSFSPPTSVTVITHSSAEAVGSAAIAHTAAVANATTPPTSFRLLNTGD
jgi:hypothetical protein